MHYHHSCLTNRVSSLEIRAAVKLATKEARVAFSSSILNPLFYRVLGLSNWLPELDETAIQYGVGPHFNDNG